MPGLDAQLGRVLIPLVTPFRSDGAVDHSTLADLSKMVVDRDFCDSIIVGGSTAEFISLSMDERKSILGTVKEAVGGRVPLIAGTGAAHTQHAIELTRLAEDLGYDVAMVVAPYYLRPTPEGVFHHYRAIANATRLPLMLYNIPLFTGFNIDAELLSRLASLSNVRAIKEEAGINPTQASEFKRVVPADFAIYCGDDTMVLQVLSQGGVGVVSGGAAVLGDRMKAMIAAYFDGHVEEAQKLHLDMFEFFRSLNQNGRINPVPLLRDAIGMTWRSVGDPRLPLLPGSEAEREEVGRVLTAIGISRVSALV